MSKKVIELDDQSFDAAIAGADVRVLVDFGATWCGPCKVLEPIVEAIAEENAGRILVAKVDIDESPNVAARYGVRGAPTILVFDKGKKIAQHVGVTSKARLLELVAT
jgi:thioredoxin 1